MQAAIQRLDAIALTGPGTAKRITIDYYVWIYSCTNHLIFVYLAELNQGIEVRVHIVQY